MEAAAGSAPELRLSQLSMIVGDVQFLHAITQLHKLDTFTCSKTKLFCTKRTSSWYCKSVDTTLHTATS